MIAASAVASNGDDFLTWAAIFATFANGVEQSSRRDAWLLFTRGGRAHSAASFASTWLLLGVLTLPVSYRVAGVPPLLVVFKEP